MISLIAALMILLAGFAVYGRFTESIFAPDDRETPAIAINDGFDCVPMKLWKAFLVQLLNIAGTGPIFGALMGACFGLSRGIAYPAGVCFAVLLFIIYFVCMKRAGQKG